MGRPRKNAQLPPTPQQPVMTRYDYSTIDPDTEVKNDPEVSEFDAVKSPRGIYAKGNLANRGVIEACRRAGSQVALSKLAGVSEVAVHKWIYDEIPPERAIEVERLTGVSRRILRPDIFNDEDLIYSTPTRWTDVQQRRYKKIEDDE